MKKLLTSIALFCMLTGTAVAEPRSVVAIFHKLERGVSVYRVVDSSKRVLGRVYYSEVTSFNLRGAVHVTITEVGFCPDIGRYAASCYKFPDMGKALSWVRREIK